jgi:cytochrome c peroxidase
MALPSHDPIVGIVNRDPDYVAAFTAAFGVDAGAITMDDVTKAIAAFERTNVGGDSPWDR